MPDNKKAKTVDEQQKMTQEYQSLMEQATPLPQVQPQWTSPAQQFAKFSLYPEYVPSYTSDHTPVLGKI